MKIAIVGPSPVPFTVGGVENLLWGLCDTINQKTVHQCELIKLPSREMSFWDLIDNYHNFYTLDVSYFDAVICTKYPAWMIQHDNCIFYVQHCLRGLYDTYHFTHLPKEVERGNKYIDGILDLMQNQPNPDSLDYFFQKVYALKEHKDEIPESYFAFPGPFIRLILMYMDRFGLSQSMWRKHYCISNTVKKRTEYFPEGAEVQVVHHPSFLKNYHCKDYKYIFMVSRLDGPKRLDMLIKAMKFVKSDIKLYIAGTGPMEKELKKLAAGDKRIQFLGFVNDDEVEEYYANSLVIPYFPYDEDFGLITIEAMMHRKPVITTRDSGGPTEFVTDYETGFVTDFDPKQIAEKIDYFAQNPEEARRMGENAYNLVKKITWEGVVNQLLEDVDVKPANRKKVTVVSTFPIYPPMGGGQARIYNLYRELAKKFDVEIVSYTNFDQSAFDGNIAKNLREIRIPRDRSHQEKMWKLEAKAKISLSDIAEITMGGETKAYVNALKESMASSDFVVVSHPYLYPLAKECMGNKPFIYEAHNVESIMKENMLPDSDVKKTLVQRVFDTEKECCNKAAFVMTCSEEDRRKLNEIYGTPLEKIIVVPNGVDTGATTFASAEQRRKNKAQLGLEYEKIGLFMGSWHGPNLDACEMIFEIAQKCPDTKFMLMGSQCLYFKDRQLPENVAMLGLVSEQAKNRIFGAVDFALNPMLGGSGTNLKMFDYMSAGIPIISTEFGTRGIDNKDLFVLADTVDEFAQAVNAFAVDREMEDRIEQAREYVEQVFDWRVIVKPLVEAANKHFS